MSNTMLERERLDWLLQFIGAAVKGERFSYKGEYELTADDWTHYEKLLSTSSLRGFLFDTLFQFSLENEIVVNTVPDWGNARKAAKRKQLNYWVQLQRILKKAEASGIKLVPFKGFVLSDLYPMYYDRTSTDTDIWVSDEQQPAAQELFRELGYELDEDETKPGVQVFYHFGNHHCVELHTRLWEDYTGKKIEILEKMNLTAPESFADLTVCNINLTTLGITEHFIFQMFHIIKHFTLQGIGMRYMVDIVFYVNKYSDQIDWKRFWESMKALDYERFCYIWFALCIEYFGMTKHESMKACEDIDEFSKLELARDLIMAGKMNEDDHASWQIFGAMTPYFVGEAKNSKGGKKLSILFPGVDSLPNNYGYAKKCSVLLPIAWIHRIILFLIHRHTDDEAVYSASEKMAVTEYRLNMLDKMGLM